MGTRKEQHFHYSKIYLLHPIALAEMVLCSMIDHSLYCTAYYVGHIIGEQASAYRLRSLGVYSVRAASLVNHEPWI